MRIEGYFIRLLEQWRVPQAVGKWRAAGGPRGGYASYSLRDRARAPCHRSLSLPSHTAPLGANRQDRCCGMRLGSWSWFVVWRGPPWVPTAHWSSGVSVAPETGESTEMLA